MIETSLYFFLFNLHRKLQTKHDLIQPSAFNSSFFHNRVSNKDEMTQHRRAKSLQRDRRSIFLIMPWSISFDNRKKKLLTKMLILLVLSLIFKMTIDAFAFFLFFFLKEEIR